MNQTCAEALQAAIELAKQGLPSFPCSSVRKRPTTPHGFYDACIDADRLTALWRDHPGSLVGVRAGTASSIDVLDLDAKHCEAAKWWAENRHRLPTTRVHRTRSGGLHVIFQHTAPLRCSTSKLERGIDIKAEGGCFIWWPAAGFQVMCDARPAVWPEWLLGQLTFPQPTRPAARLVVPDDRRLRQILQRVSTAREGERNALTYWGACRLGEMTGTGLLSEANAIALVAEAAAFAGLPRSEAIATARSGLRAAGVQS